jgi:hypothetical protein
LGAAVLLVAGFRAVVLVGADFLAPVFLAVVFLFTVFLPRVFLAVVFLAAVFFVPLLPAAVFFVPAALAVALRTALVLDPPPAEEPFARVPEVLPVFRAEAFRRAAAPFEPERPTVFFAAAPRVAVPGDLPPAFLPALMGAGM